MEIIFQRSQDELKIQADSLTCDWQYKKKSIGFLNLWYLKIDKE